MWRHPPESRGEDEVKGANFKHRIAEIYAIRMKRLLKTRRG
jgi:hypothetical protein